MSGARRPGNTVDTVYQTLRDRIIDGDYPPGVRMSQDGLATELNVSRTPLREALHRLEADGLVVAEANRGMEVAPISDGQVEQCYAIRLLVEPPTIAAIVGSLTPDDIADMAEALDEMEKNSNRIRDYQESHLRFHEIALRRYPAAIRELTQSLHLKIYRHQRLHFSRPQVPEHFNHVDRMLLEAMEKNEPELARHVMEFHLADAAIGITMDKDPDYRFDALLVALQGLGIQLDPVEDGVLPRPVHIRWRNGAPSLQALETANLRYLPDDTSPTKKAAS